jgi:hypothetical protein
MITELQQGPADGIEIAKGVTKQVAREGVDVLNLVKLGGKLYWALLKIPISDPATEVALVLHDYAETDQKLDNIEWINPTNDDQTVGKVVTQLATFMSPASIKYVATAGVKALTDISTSFLDPKNITRDNVAKLLQLSEKTITNPTFSGHTFQKHIAKSDEDLIKRVQDNINQGKASTATTFYDQATAEKAIRDVLQTTEGQKMVKNAVQFSQNGKAERFERIFELGRDIGKGFESADNLVQPLDGNLTRMKLVIEADRKGGFTIISSYPVK